MKAGNGGTGCSPRTGAAMPSLSGTIKAKPPNGSGRGLRRMLRRGKRGAVPSAPDRPGALC